VDIEQIRSLVKERKYHLTLHAENERDADHERSNYVNHCYRLSAGSR